MTAELTPDVVLMDVRMPLGDGIEATRQITASGSGARIIILTTFDLDEYAFAGLQAGASAFLLKDVAPEELVHAVRVVASGDAVVNEDRLRHAIAQAQGDPRVLGEVVDQILGAPWDAELEAYREAGDGAPVRWLHKVG